jgi:Ca2+-binding RTX toxin-like protein
MKTRILLGALIGASALAAIPTAANATATCTFDSAKRQMNLRYAAADTNITVRNGPQLQFGKAGESFRACFSTTGVQATAANTDRVRISAASGTGAAQQTTTIDETNGDFSASNPNLRFTVLTGTGGDRLIVKEGSGNQFVQLHDQTGVLAIGPAVDLDTDGDDDIVMTSGFDSVVQVFGGIGNDILDAGPATVFQVRLEGEAGTDTLRGGARQDVLVGGSEDDGFFSKDGAKDILRGDSGNDHATMDLFNPLDDATSVEQQK